MLVNRTNGRRWAMLAGLSLIAIAAPAAPVNAQAGLTAISEAEGIHAGQLDVPINKSQVLRVDRPYARALVGNPGIADVLPLTDQSIYVLGKTAGTTSLTLYDRANRLIAVVDVAVGPDVLGLRRQLSELLPAHKVAARLSNDSVVLEGIVGSGPEADRAVQLAETYAPGKVVNLLSVGSAQQVMLEVKFAEVKRSALKDLGFGLFVKGGGGHGFGGASGNNAGISGTGDAPDLTLGSVAGSFGVLARNFNILGLGVNATMNALERKGAINVLAEPNLVALSGETASFLAGGEFPIPVSQGGGGQGLAGGGTGGNSITIEFKPFGVSLAFTPTVLADGVINLVVAPEVSSIDDSASVVVNGLRVPGLQTRRARTTVELRDGEAFALAGLIRRDFSNTVRQFPVLGSIPIIGSLFRSTSFQRDETELVIVVTPRLVRPVPAGSIKLPTDRTAPPNEAELFLLGRTDRAVPVPLLGQGPATPGLDQAPASATAPATAPVAAPVAGTAGAALNLNALEKDYGHDL